MPAGKRLSRADFQTLQTPGRRRMSDKWEPALTDTLRGCDVQSIFHKVSQDWLIRFVEHRLGDRRIIRLITKWLKAGALEDGRLVVTEEGDATPPTSTRGRGPGADEGCGDAAWADTQ
jgi:hypothetical protein